MGYGYLGSYFAYGIELDGENQSHRKLLFQLDPYFFPQDEDEDGDEIDDGDENGDQEDDEVENEKKSDIVSDGCSLTRDVHFPHIFIKQYGTDDGPHYFVFWSTCWRGGGFWDSSCIGKPDGEKDPIQLMPIKDLSEPLRVQNSFDNSEWQRFCDKYSISTDNVPYWQTLMTFGQMIY